MGFKLFFVFVALTAVINLSGRCRGQSYCILTPCGKEVRTENSCRIFFLHKLTLLDTMSNLSIQYSFPCNIYNKTSSIILALSMLVFE